MSCFKEILISEVQSRPILWQDTNKHFKNKSVTDKLWTEVGLACGVDGNIAKSKWKNLKDQFRRESQKIPALKSGSQAISTKSKWQYFESMQFLRDYTTPAPTQGNLNDASRSQVNETQDDSEIITDDEIEHSASNDESDVDVTMNSSLLVATPSSNAESVSRRRHRQSEASTSRSQSQLSTSRPSSNASGGSEIVKRRISQKRNAQNLNQEYLELQKKKVTLLEKEVNRGDELESADLHFFRSLLPYMERLSLFDKLELRSTIQQLVFDKFKEAMTHQQPTVPQKPQSVTQQQPPVQQQPSVQQNNNFDTFPRRPLQLQRESQYDEILNQELLPCQPSQQPLPVSQYENDYYPRNTQEDFLSM